MGYTQRFVSPLIGLGASSISDSWDVFVQNEKQTERYEELVAQGEIPIFRGHQLNPEDRILRRHILNLMTRFETSWDNPDVYVPFLDTVEDRLEEPIRDGLLRIDGKRCEVTQIGRAFLRNICMAFDARLAREAPGSKLFSQTI